ncbi:MAG: hypothetical protein ACRDRZ_00805 [Pseudonocardiaceae bacterium]
MRTLDQVREIVVPAVWYAQLVQHARRKLAGEYLPDEEAAPKAYGLLGGRFQAQRMVVTLVFPLRRNLRHAAAYKSHVDQLMDEVAVPSETPTDKRGWVSDPTEVLAAERECEARDSVLFGSYHMHRVAWDHDPKRDCCTELDTRLAEDSGLWAFILSMVDPDRPVLRAFFEGHNEREAPVRIVLADHAGESYAR